MKRQHWDVRRTSLSLWSTRMTRCSKKWNLSGKMLITELGSTDFGRCFSMAFCWNPGMRIKAWSACFKSFQCARCFFFMEQTLLLREVMNIGNLAFMFLPNAAPPGAMHALTNFSTTTSTIVASWRLVEFSYSSFGFDLQWLWRVYSIGALSECKAMRAFKQSILNRLLWEVVVFVDLWCEEGEIGGQGFPSRKVARCYFRSLLIRIGNHGIFPNTFNLTGFWQIWTNCFVRSGIVETFKYM